MLTLIFCTLLLANNLLSDDEICSSVVGETNKVEWPSTSTKTLSKPRCTDQNKELVYRECLHGKWGPEPTCFHIQKEKIPVCPDNYTETGSICYAFSPGSSFLPKCPSEDVLPFETYRYLIPEDVVSFWMPVRRDLSNGVGLMRWTEASSVYNTEFRDKIHAGLARGHDCVVYHSEDYIEAVSCDEVHPRICAYKKWGQTMETELCEEQGQCVQSSFFDRSRCICLGSGAVKKPLVEFSSLDQNNVYTFLTKEECSIGLIKQNDTYIWSNSKKEIEYTFWSENVTFDLNHIYGASTTGGWILTKSLLTCFLYEIEVVEEEPTLELTYSEGTFALYVTNNHKMKKISDEVLVFCFTNAESSDLVSQITKTQKRDYGEKLLVLEFDKVSKAPGLYWCEGFSTDLKVVRSEYFVDIPEDYFEFVSFFLISESDDETITDSTIDYIRNNMLLVFEEDTSLENITARMMKLEYLDDNILVNIHFTVGKTKNEEEESCKNLQDVIQYLFSEVEGFKFLQIHSASFCYAEYDTKLKWPRTSVTEDTFPEEFCMTEDGRRVTRRCEGNFIDGAHWSNYDDCVIFQPSNISYKLQQLIDNDTDQLAKDIPVITDYENFTSLDVNLVAELYRLRFDTSSDNVTSLANTINALANIDKNILKEAQQEMKATDKLLTVLHNVMVSRIETYDISLGNFAYVSDEGLRGLMVLEDNSLNKMMRSYTFLEIISTENIKSAIWLNPEQSDKDKAAISIFYDDSFFQGVPSQNTGIIFGLTFPNALQFFPKPVTVLHKIEDGYNEDGECMVWDQKISNRGLWVKSGSQRTIPKFVLCEYYQSGYFALTYTSNTSINVTNELLSALGSETPNSQLMSTLYHISKRYYEFAWCDIKYVGKIFEQVTYDEKIDLKDLTKTVSNLHNIKRDILIESQKREKSTDMILAYIDDIIQKNKSQSIIKVRDEHFMILIINLKVTTFNGVALLKDKNSFETEILNDHLSLAEVVEYDNFDSVLYLNPKLKNQINDSTIIITVFNNDALFNEISNQSRDVSKIFGVILPDVGKYLGPVTVLHKVNEDNYGQCVHWNYNISTNDTGFWKGEEDGSTFGHGLVQCDFWHTTHFALLLLARDSNTSCLQFESLDIITTTTTVISLISLNCVVLTAIFFKEWRRNTGNQILLNLTIIVMVQLIIFYISGSINNDSKSYFLCTLIGLLLHYSTISQFCWMLVVAVLQYWRYVLVLKAPPNYLLLKSCLCGWVLPLVPVACVYFWNRDNYTSGQVGLCYPSDWGLYLGVWFPVAFIIVFNCTTFVIILYNITCRRKKFTDIDRKEMVYQWRLGVLLFFVLGLTWVFGFLANFNHNASIFVYMFCTTATLEGFVIFVFFIVCNPDTRYLYMRAVKKYSFRQNK